MLRSALTAVAVAAIIPVSAPRARSVPRLKVKRNYLVTAVAELLAVVSYIVVFRVVSDRLGPVGFAEYALGRRVLSLLFPIAVLGLDLAVTRFVAGTDEDRPLQASFVPAALAGVLVECALLALIALTFSKPLSSLLFGSPDYPDLIVAMPVLLLGLCFQGVVYGYLRAQVQVIRAGSLLLATLVAMPLLASLVGPSVSAMFWITGVGWALLSLVFLFGTEVAISRAWPAIRSLLRYGGPRVPGDILMLLLFSAPPIIAAHTDGIRAAGAVAFAMASLRMIGSVITFFLLPSATRLLARGEREQARREVFVIARWILPLLALGTIAFEIAGDRILSAYLGDSIAGGLAEVKLVMLAAVPWGTFVLLKTVVDAHHLNPINARNLLISAVAFAVAAAGLGSAHQSGLPILTAFVGSMFLLAALTVIEVIRITSSSPRPMERLADA